MILKCLQGGHGLEDISWIKEIRLLTGNEAFKPCVLISIHFFPNCDFFWSRVSIFAVFFHPPAPKPRWHTRRFFVIS